MRDSPPRRECACAVAGSLHLCFPSHCSPRRGSGSGGTMFTSTGSSGLCEYRPPPSWLYPTRHAAHLLKEAGGGGGLRVAGRLGADPPSRRPHLGAACPWGAAGTAPTSACGGEWGLSPAASPAPSAYQPQVRCSGALGTVAGGQLASGWGRWCPGPAPALRGACARPRGAAVLLEARLEAGPFLVTLLHSFRLTRDQWGSPSRVKFQPLVQQLISVLLRFLSVSLT